MFHPRTEFKIPEGKYPIPQDFIDAFYLSFSQNGEVALKEYNKIMSDPSNIFYLLEMIKEAFNDQNENFQVLTIILSLLQKFIHCKEHQIVYDEDFNVKLFDPINFLLPYTVEIYQKTGNIQIFQIFLKIIHSLFLEEKEIIALFNIFIADILSNKDQITIEKAIIAFHFSAYLLNNFLTEENHRDLAITAFNMIQYLPNCSGRSDNEVELFKILFKRMSFKISKQICPEIFPIENLNEICQKFFKNFIDDCDKSLENNAQIMKYFLIFLKIFFSCVSEKDDEKEHNFCFEIYNFIYHNSIILNQASQFLCAKEILEFIDDNIKYMRLDFNDQNEMNFFVNFVFNFSALRENDILDATESVENFFFGNYEVEGQNFSPRQIIAHLLFRMFCNDITAKFVLYLLTQIFQTDIQKFGEIHMFIISQINNILFKFLNAKKKNISVEGNDDYDDDEEEELGEKQKNEEKKQFFINVIQANLVNFIPELSRMSNACLSNPQSLNDTNNLCLIFSYLYLISTSFQLLSDDFIVNFNAEVQNIFNIITIDNGRYFNSVFFTNLCMISANLLVRDKLDGQDKFYQLIDQNCQSCLTNDANDFIYLFALKTSNPDIFMKAFTNYMLESKNYLVGFRLSQDADVEKNGIFSFVDQILNSKEMTQSLNRFEKSIEKMISIISIFDCFTFPEEEENKDNNENKDSNEIKEVEKLSLIELMILFEEDWILINETIEFTSIVFEKAINVESLVNKYLSCIVKSGRCEGYGEWVQPIVSLVSARSPPINQKICDDIFICLNVLFNSNKINSEYTNNEITMLSSLVIRLFELAYLKIVVIPPDILQSYCIWIRQINSNKDNIIMNINEIMIHWSAFLAGMNVDYQVLNNYFKYVITNKLVFGNEMRLMIILLINNFFPENIRPKFGHIVQACMNCTFPKNEVAYNTYLSKRKYLFLNIKHPIVFYNKLDNFVYE